MTDHQNGQTECCSTICPWLIVLTIRVFQELMELLCYPLIYKYLMLIFASCFQGKERKKKKKITTACQTCTRVAKSSWKKKIKISSLALSLHSELASNPWSPPPLNSHPASTLKFLCLCITSWPAKNNLCAQWCQRKFLSLPVRIWVFLINWKCLPHKAVDP